MSKRTWTLLVSMVLVASTAQAGFTVDVFGGVAPNFVNSPSWLPYANTATNSLLNNSGSVGDQSTDPTAYRQLSNMEEVSVATAAVTSAPLWMGIVNPSSPFQNEHGSRVDFGVHAVSDNFNDTFTLADICVHYDSDDTVIVPNGLLDLSIRLGDFASVRYQSFAIGINWGPDMLPGTLDDIVYDNDDGTLGNADDDPNNPIHELAYVGIGQAFNLNPSDEQDEVNADLEDLESGGKITLTGTYELKDTIGNVLATGTSSVILVPEPGTAGLLALATCGLAAIRRRRQA